MESRLKKYLIISSVLHLVISLSFLVPSLFSTKDDNKVKITRLVLSKGNFGTNKKANVGKTNKLPQLTPAQLKELNQQNANNKTPGAEGKGKEIAKQTPKADPKTDPKKTVKQTTKNTQKQDSKQTTKNTQKQDSKQTKQTTKTTKTKTPEKAKDPTAINVDKKQTTQDPKKTTKTTTTGSKTTTTTGGKTPTKTTQPAKSGNNKALDDALSRIDKQIKNRGGGGGGGVPQTGPQTTGDTGQSPWGSDKGSDVDPALVKYDHDIKMRVRKYWNSIRIGFSGKLVARITVRIDAKGNVIRTEINKSSGSASFDQGALRAIKSASPFPVPPPSVRDEALNEGFLIDFTTK